MTFRLLRAEHGAGDRLGVRRCTSIFVLASRLDELRQQVRVIDVLFAIGTPAESSLRRAALRWCARHDVRDVCSGQERWFGCWPTMPRDTEGRAVVAASGANRFVAGTRIVRAKSAREEPACANFDAGRSRMPPRFASTRQNFRERRLGFAVAER